MIVSGTRLKDSLYGEEASADPLTFAPGGNDGWRWLPLRNTAASVVAASAVLLPTASRGGYGRSCGCVPGSPQQGFRLLPISQPTSTGKNGDRSWHDTGGQPRRRTSWLRPSARPDLGTATGCLVSLQSLDRAGPRGSQLADEGCARVVQEHGESGPPSVRTGAHRHRGYPSRRTTMDGQETAGA